MHKTFLVSTLGLVALALTPALAHAQTSSLKGELGVSVLANKDSRDATQDAGFALGLGYALPNATMQGALSADAFFTRSSGHGNSVETIGIYLAERIPLSQGSTAATRPYFGGAIGFSQSRVRERVGEVGTTSETVSKDKGGAAFRLLAGMAFGGGMSAELSYNFNPTVKFGPSSVRTDTISLTIGKKF